jgi:hypothetical protein
MTEQGVRRDDPEYIKARNLLSAVQRQQVYHKQQQFAQHQLQAQQRQQQLQQVNGSAADAGPNGVNGRCSTLLCSRYFLFFKLMSCLTNQKAEVVQSHPPRVRRKTQTQRPLVANLRLQASNIQHLLRKVYQVLQGTFRPNSSPHSEPRLSHSSCCPKTWPYRQESSSNCSV